MAVQLFANSASNVDDDSFASTAEERARENILLQFNRKMSANGPENGVIVSTLKKLLANLVAILPFFLRLFRFSRNAEKPRNFSKCLEMRRFQFDVHSCFTEKF